MQNKKAAFSHNQISRHKDNLQHNIINRQNNELHALDET